MKNDEFYDVRDRVRDRKLQVDEIQDYLKRKRKEKEERELEEAGRGSYQWSLDFIAESNEIPKNYLKRILEQKFFWIPIKQAEDGEYVYAKQISPYLFEIRKKYMESIGEDIVKDFDVSFIRRKVKIAKDRFSELIKAMTAKKKSSFIQEESQKLREKELCKAISESLSRSQLQIILKSEKIEDLIIELDRLIKEETDKKKLKILRRVRDKLKNKEEKEDFYPYPKKKPKYPKPKSKDKYPKTEDDEDEYPYPSPKKKVASEVLDDYFNGNADEEDLVNVGYSAEEINLIKRMA